jgi:hypothetical protein
VRTFMDNDRGDECLPVTVEQFVVETNPLRPASADCLSRRRSAEVEGHPWVPKQAGVNGLGLREDLGDLFHGALLERGHSHAWVATS